MSEENILDVLMPQMGVSVNEGTVVNWRVSVGDEVADEQVVCDITTDKTDAEILAPAGGVIVEILVPEGSAVEVGLPVARLAAGGAGHHPAPAIAIAFEEAMAAATSVSTRADKSSGTSSPPIASLADLVPEPIVATSKASDIPAAAAFVRATRSVAQMLAGANIDPAAAANAVLDRPPRHARPLSSPLARRRASERNIDLATVSGSGLRGRICVQDVLSVARTKGPSVPSQTRSVVMTVNEANDVMPIGYDDVPFEFVTTSPHRRAISEHMRRSRQVSAHMTTEVDVDMFQVSKVRSLFNAAREASGLGRISFLSFITKAAVGGLSEYPDLNATFQHERAIQWREVNVGIAVDTPAGLIVPVVRRVQDMPVEEIASAIATVADRARTRALTPDDLRAGTFTISNPGSVGAVSALAIINQPQVAILGIPVIVKRPWVISTAEGADAIAIRPILRLALTFDHRAVDGAYATRYVVRVKDLLENWDASSYS